MTNNELTNIDKILFLGPQGSYSEIAKNIFIDKFGIPGVQQTPNYAIFGFDIFHFFIKLNPRFETLR